MRERWKYLCKRFEFCYFGNCIIDGNLSTEVSFQENEIGNFNYTFDHSLIKIDTLENNTNTSNFNNVIKNKIT